MSFVTGVTLQTSMLDGEDSNGNLGAINQWLIDRGFGRLLPVADRYGGSMHPEVCVFGGGYNYLPCEEFIKYVLKLNWRLPSEMVMLISTNGDPTQVYRAG